MNNSSQPTSLKTKPKDADSDKNDSNGKKEERPASNNTANNPNNNSNVNDNPHHIDEPADDTVEAEPDINSTEITIQNCRIQNTDINYTGIRIHGGMGSLNLINNYIFNNGGDGIKFSDSSKGGPHLIEKILFLTIIKKESSFPKNRN